MKFIIQMGNGKYFMSLTEGKVIECLEPEHARHFSNRFEALIAAASGGNVFANAAIVERREPVAQEA